MSIAFAAKSCVLIGGIQHNTHLAMKHSVLRPSRGLVHADRQSTHCMVMARLNELLRILNWSQPATGRCNVSTVCWAATATQRSHYKHKTHMPPARLARHRTTGGCEGLNMELEQRQGHCELPLPTGHTNRCPAKAVAAAVAPALQVGSPRYLW